MPFQLHLIPYIGYTCAYSSTYVLFLFGPVVFPERLLFQPQHLFAEAQSQSAFAAHSLRSLESIDSSAISCRSINSSGASVGT